MSIAHIYCIVETVNFPVFPFSFVFIVLKYNKKCVRVSINCLEYCCCPRNPYWNLGLLHCSLKLKMRVIEVPFYFVIVLFSVDGTTRLCWKTQHFVWCLVEEGWDRTGWEPIFSFENKHGMTILNTFGNNGFWPLWFHDIGCCIAATLICLLEKGRIGMKNFFEYSNLVVWSF